MNTAYTINNQRLSWPWVQSVRHRLGGEWQRVMWALYQARNSTNIVAYVEKGLKNGGYSFVPPADWENGNRATVETWWRSVTGFRPTKNAGMSTIKQIFKQLAGE